MNHGYHPTLIADNQVSTNRDILHQTHTALNENLRHGRTKFESCQEDDLKRLHSKVRHGKDYEIGIKKPSPKSITTPIEEEEEVSHAKLDKSLAFFAALPTTQRTLERTHEKELQTQHKLRREEIGILREFLNTLNELNLSFRNVEHKPQHMNRPRSRSATRPPRPTRVVSFKKVHFDLNKNTYDVDSSFHSDPLPRKRTNQVAGILRKQNSF